MDRFGEFGTWVLCVGIGALIVGWFSLLVIALVLAESNPVLSGILFGAWVAVLIGTILYAQTN